MPYLDCSLQLSSPYSLSIKSFPCGISIEFLNNLLDIDVELNPNNVEFLRRSENGAVSAGPY